MGEAWARLHPHSGPAPIQGSGAGLYLTWCRPKSSRHGGAAPRDQREIGQALHISSSKGVVTYFLGMDSYLLTCRLMLIVAESALFPLFSPFRAKTALLPAVNVGHAFG